MVNTNKALYILIITLIFATKSGAEWIPIGSCINNSINANASYFETCLYNHTPYIAWTESDGGKYNLYVKHYKEIAWEQIGVSLNINSDLDAAWPQIAVDQGTPYVVWQEQETKISFISKVYVKKYTETGWEQLGTSSLNIISDNIAAGASIYIYNGTPYVAWTELDWPTPGKVYMKYFDGNDWQFVGMAATTVIGEEFTISNTSCFVESNGTPYVSWKDTEGYIYINFYNGSDWIQQDSYINEDISKISSYPERYSVELKNYNSQQYIVWNEIQRNDENINHIYLKYYNGMDWQLIGTHINNKINEIADYAGVSFKNNTPIVCWQEQESEKYKSYVKYFDGNEWKYFDDDSKILNTNKENKSEKPEIITSDDDEIYASYIEVEDYRKIYVKFYASPTITPTYTITPTSTISPTITLTSTQTATVTQTTTPYIPPFPAGCYAVPNPFIPLSNNPMANNTVIEFNSGHISPNYTIKFMNLRGKIVRTLHSQRIWDGKNDSGNLCPGGVYIYQVEVEGKRVSGKVVLIK